MQDQSHLAGVYPASADFVAHAHVDGAKYEAMYAASVADPDAFWAREAERIDWINSPTKIKNTDFTYGQVSIKWFEDGTLNIAANCVDRHVAQRGNQTAIIWEPDDPKTPARHITYTELLEGVCRMANVLKAHGVRKGDRVVLYLPMIPEAAYAMLACARIGAIHSIVFAGFSPDALANRINDSEAKVVITADFAPRGGKKTALKSNADAALLHCNDHVKCLVVKHTGDQTSWTNGRDFDLKRMSDQQCQVCHQTQFAGFERGHPEFKDYPYARRTRQRFDHVTHWQRYFPDAKLTGAGAPTSCASCHEPALDGRQMMVKNYEQTCASCHDGQIKGDGRTEAKGFAFLRLPGFDRAALEAAGETVGEWPDRAALGLTPFMRRLLEGDPTARAALQDLGPANITDLAKATPAQKAAAGRLLWSVKGLIADLTTEGQTAILRRLGPRPAGAAAINRTGQFSAESLQAAQRAWLPNLLAEVAAYRRGEKPPAPPAAAAPAPAFSLAALEFDDAEARVAELEGEVRLGLRRRGGPARGYEGRHRGLVRGLQRRGGARAGAEGVHVLSVPCDRAGVDHPAPRLRRSARAPGRRVRALYRAAGTGAGRPSRSQERPWLLRSLRGRGESGAGNTRGAATTGARRAEPRAGAGRRGER